MQAGEAEVSMEAFKLFVGGLKGKILLTYNQ